MIIGITGTLGAGKGTVAEYLVKHRGFTYLSVRNFLAGEVVRRGLVVNRDTITQVANELRAQRGAGWIVDQLLTQAIEQTRTLRQKGVVIESIRSIGEAQILKSKSALLWAVDAGPQTRYQRIVGRGSTTDSVSFEKFLEDEKREWDNADPNKQNLKGVMAIADETFTNNGTQEELFAQVEAGLKKASNH